MVVVQVHTYDTLVEYVVAEPRNERIAEDEADNLPNVLDHTLGVEMHRV